MQGNSINVTTYEFSFLNLGTAVADRFYVWRKRYFIVFFGDEPSIGLYYQFKVRQVKHQRGLRAFRLS
jgi:hypothetical protein